MARKRKYQNLYVYMNDRSVGILTRESTGQLSFQYDEKWLSWESSRPLSLSMPLTQFPYKGDLVENYFDNLLPDNEVIRERIQTRFNLPSKKCFDLLSYIGADCVGAVQLLTEPKLKNIQKIQARPLSSADIAKLLKHYKTAPLGMAREFDFRISIAGAQEKTALLWHQNKWWLPQGTTPTSHIIKLPIGQIKHAGIDLSESVENEWLCLEILSLYDLPVNKAEIKQFEDVKTLIVQRFDRQWTSNHQWLMRLPQEDLCQALNFPAALKYESDGGPGIQDIMTILRGAEETITEREKFMKTVFLFWVLGAIDGHAKNFSLHLQPQGRYKLTPLYDVISAYPLAAKRQIEWQDLKMAMSLKSKSRHYSWKNIQKRHWLAMAQHCQFPPDKMQTIIEEICDTMEDKIEQVTQLLPKNFPSHISDAIFDGMQQIKNRCK